MIESSIPEHIAIINLLMADLEKKNNITNRALEELTNESYQLIKKMNGLIINIQMTELEEYIIKVQRVMEQLHQIEQGKEKDVVSPNELLDDITSAFENFFNRTISKQRQEQLKTLIEYVPYINNVAYCCETMPYFWAHANRTQKVSMVLAAALIVTSLVLSVAIAASPALPALPIIGPVALILSRLGRILYNSSIATPKQEYEDKQKLISTKKALNEQEEFFNANIKPKFEKPTLTKKTLTHQKPDSKAERIQKTDLKYEQKRKAKSKTKKPKRDVD